MNIVEFLASAVLAFAPHRLFFMLMSAVSSLIVSAGSLWLRREILKGEIWVTYFGMGFLMFSLQYFATSAYSFYDLPGKASAGEIYLISVLAGLADIASSLLFLAMSRVLLSRRNAFPWWALLWAALALMVHRGDLLATWTRLPEALLESFSFSMAGYALFRNIISRRRPEVAIWVLGTGFLLASLQLAFALNPPVTQGNLWLPFRVTLVDELSRAGFPAIYPTEAVDTFLLPWDLVARLLLAAAGFAVIIKTLTVISPRPMLQRSSGTTDFIQERLAPLGESFAADRIKLWIRLPGLRDQKVACWVWTLETLAGGATRNYTASVPAPGDLGIGDVLVTSQPILIPRRQDSATDIEGQSNYEDGSLLAVPIIRHGSVVGCLQVEWSEPFAFTTTTIAQATRFADFLAPLVEQRRFLAVLESWGPSVRTLDLGSKADTCAVVGAFADIVYDTLAPHAVLLSVEIGFLPVWALRGIAADDLGVADREPMEALERFHTIAGGHETLFTPLEAEGVRIGTLGITWPHPEESTDGPVIYSDPFHRSALGSLIAGSMIEVTRERLWSILDHLQIQLGSIGVESQDGWRSALEEAARAAGLVWMVASVEGRLLGLAEASRMVERIADSDLKSPQQGGGIQLATLSVVVAEARSLVKVLLPATQAELWLGISRPGFGIELERSWPWRIFLERFAEAADVTLARIVARDEVARLRKEADQAKGLLAATADTTSLVHDLRNLARNFQFAAQALEDANKVGILQAPDPLSKSISSLVDSARRLYALTDSIMQPPQGDQRSVYPLIEPVQSVQTLLDPILRQHKIQLQVSVSPSLLVRFPFHLAHQALLGLISNSIDAIRSNGTIRIAAEDSASSILCHIIDDGPGVSPDIAAHIFDLGITTKSAGGRGLFLVRILLREHGGEAMLTESRPGRTVFSVSFPKVGD